MLSILTNFKNKVKTYFTSLVQNYIKTPKNRVLSTIAFLVALALVFMAFGPIFNNFNAENTKNGGFNLSKLLPNQNKNQQENSSLEDNSNQPELETAIIEQDGFEIEFEMVEGLDVKVEEVFLKRIQVHSKWLASKIGRPSQKPLQKQNGQKTEGAIRLKFFTQTSTFISYVLVFSLASDKNWVELVPENIALSSRFGGGPSLITARDVFNPQTQFTNFLTQRIREDLNLQIDPILREKPEYGIATDFNNHPIRFQIGNSTDNRQKLIFWFSASSLGLENSQAYGQNNKDNKREGNAQIYKVEVSIDQLFEYTSATFLERLFGGYIKANEEKIVNAKQLFIGTETYNLEVEGKNKIDCKIQKCVALTFDDGPNCTETPKLLDYLEGSKATATFYVVGSAVKKCPEVLARMAKNGHEIGNHTWSHPKLTKMSEGEIWQQINKTQKAIFDASGVYPTQIRPPYGAENQKVLDSIGMPAVNWNVDPMDWKNRDSKKIKEYVLKYTNNGSVVLSHDIHLSTVEAYRSIIPELKNSGFSFVSVSQILDLPTDYKEVKGGKIYFDMVK